MARYMINGQWVQAPCFSVALGLSLTGSELAAMCNREAVPRTEVSLESLVVPTEVQLQQRLLRLSG